MTNSYDKFMQELRDEAERDGVVAEFDALDAAFALGAQLLRRRKELAITQQALASFSGVPQAEISRIERGQANPTIATLAKLAMALGGGSVSIQWRHQSSLAVDNEARGQAQ